MFTRAIYPLSFVSAAKLFGANPMIKGANSRPPWGNLKPLAHFRHFGAYENNIDAHFSLLHPTLNPDGHNNGNDSTNFQEGDAVLV